MNSISEDLPSGHDIAVILATLAALAVAAATFTRSFSALSDLAVMHEWPAGEAWILPIALDGMIVVPTVAAVVRRSARWYAWSLLVAGTILSCAGNGVYAWLTTSSRIAVALAVIPPLVTFFAVHLAIVVARQGHDTDNVAAPTAEPGPTVAPDDHDKATRDTDRDETPRPVTRLHVAPATPPRPAATPTVATPRAESQPTLTLDVAPTATDDQLRARAIHLVDTEGMSMRATGAKLGVSKDKVHRWVAAHRASVATATAAV